MKRILSLILAVAIMALTIPVASALNYKGFICEKNSQGTYTITGCNLFSDESIVIPEEINGVKVTAIGQGAFQSKKSLASVTIPDSITSIGLMAFHGCPNLISVFIGEGVTNIGAKAFSGCSSLESINVKNTQMLGEYAFMGCKSLESFITESNLKVIGRSAFEGCELLSFMNLGENLLYIDKLAFSDCSAITEMNFPDTLGYIGERAFKNCSSLAEINIGTGELKIDAYAFENCSSLTEIAIPNNVTSIGQNAFAITNRDDLGVAHNITVICSQESPALSYLKAANVSVYVTELDTTISSFGDIDGNGQVETADAVSTLDIVSGIEEYHFTDYEMFLYDLNCDNRMDTDDVVIMLRKAAGLS